MSDVVVIARRFRGPPDSANGGYACGLLGTRLEAAARVRLNLPPPLDEPLTVRPATGGHLTLLHGRAVVAEGVAATPHVEIPAPVGIETAERAATRYRWTTGHPFPGCFVCGPERHAGDGLRIFPGPVAGRAIVAAPWTPDATVCDASGHVHPEILWAALDCPSWFGVLEFEAAAGLALLGQMTARILRRPALGEPCVVTGWSRGRDGRKLYGGAALFTGTGVLLGSSDAIWIELKE